MPKDKAIAIAADKCSREKHSTQCTSPPWSNEKIAINKKQVSSQLFKCCKNTRHGASGDTAFFKKHSNINGFRTPEQRNYLYSTLLKPSISAAIARFISR